MQRENRITYKAVAGEGEESTIVGFVTWNLPKPKKEELGGDGKGEGQAKKEKGGLPSLPGVNVDLWMQKVNGTRVFSERDLDPEKDMGEIPLFYPYIPLFSSAGKISLLIGVSRSPLMLRASRVSASRYRVASARVGETKSRCETSEDLVYEYSTSCECL